MSRQVRHRFAAGVLGGLLLGLPLATSGSASAGPAGACADRVSDPAPVTVTPARPGEHRARPGRTLSTPEPISAISIAPSRGSAVLAPGTPPSIRPGTPTAQVKRLPARVVRGKTKITRGTDRSAPTAAGKSSGTRKSNLHGVPGPGPSPTGSAPAAPAAPGPDVAAGQVARAEPIPEHGLIGLLAAVSMVLVLGVSAGLIRAIVLQRASRTKIA